MSVFYRQCNMVDGTYSGKQGGYRVHVLLSDGGVVWFETENGLRGRDIPVTVVVKDGVATVTVVKRSS
jgi:hypothetical protein